MKTVTLTATASLEAVVRDVERDEDILILRDGRPVALLTPFDNDDLEWYAREREPGFIGSIAKARQQVESGQTVGQEALRRELGL